MSVETLIERLTAVFGEPRTDAPEIFLAEYRRSLSGYAADVLEKAGDRVINDATYWPRPAEVRKAAGAVAEEIEAINRAAQAVSRAEHQPFVSTPQDPDEKRRVQEAFVAYKRELAAESLEQPEPVKQEWLTLGQFRAMQLASPNKGLHRGRR